MITSSRPFISRYDKAFKEDHTRNYHLTIRLSPDGFSFVVFSLDKNRYLGLEAFNIKQLDNAVKMAAALDEISMIRQWITYPFHSVLVIIDHAQNTIVPNPLYEEKEKGVYLAFNQPFQDNCRIQSDAMKAADAHNIFYLSNPLMEKIKDIWANSRVVHIQSVLIESLLIAQRNKATEQTAFVHVRNDSFDLVVLKNEKLSFVNNFRFNTPEDFVYFLLFSMDQLRLNPETVLVVLSGMIEKGSANYDILYQYIRNLSFAERNTSFEYSYMLEELPVHQHFVLYNALQCEL
ncbi:MAG: hypothetical protein FD155_977 [Bacteroidetes bacterium]|nr:MAG: hypothetical protein FD155_977 [Bacteroidota bacterium]